MIKHPSLDSLEILCEVDISALSTLPSSTLYRRLLPYLSESYHHTQRFVFYAFRPVSAEVLTHLSDILEWLDISSYFVEVFTDQSELLEWCRTRPEPIKCTNHYQALWAELGQSKPIFPNSTMCGHAWAGLHVNVEGTVKVCCDFQENITKPDGTLYDLKTSTVDEIINSPYMKSIKQTFRQGQTPSQCSRCLHYESLGRESKRTVSKFKLSNVLGFIDWESDDNTNTPLFMAANAGNLCNLKCRNCRPALSSKIAAEELQHGNDEEKTRIRKIIDANDWSKGKSKIFWDILKTDSRFVNFEFMGGETLLSEENLEFMQHLVDTGRSQDCAFEIVTNVTVFPKILEHMKFKRLSVTLSIDDINQRCEYQRSGSDWNNIIENIDKWLDKKKHNKNLALTVCITVSIQNVLYLPELVTWLRNKGLDNYWLNMLDRPYELSIKKNLSRDAKKIILEKYANFDLDHRDRNHLQYVVSTIKESDTVDSTDRFCDFIRKKDIIRQEDFSDAHPEMAAAMGYKKNV